jgi:crotonobetainyl-CoA:carnitine CoA-transferase CaiB-like acyl-CoA transferase
MLPLEGIRVLDTTRYLPGPFCTMWLGDMGADVIKIEETERRGVDYASVFPDLFKNLDINKREDLITAYQLTNRNKRSLCLNLKSEAGRSIFYELAQKADVVVIESRPGVSKRLGIDYETLRKVNARIIQCEISTYGQTGPYHNLPAHDPNCLGLAGVLGIMGTSDGQYVLPGVPIGDLGGGGLQAVIGILLALQAREKTGFGQFVDISMYSGMLSWFAVRWGQTYLLSGIKEKSGLRPTHVYQTMDGKHIVIAPPEPWMWERLCRGLGLEEYIPFREKAMMGPVSDPKCKEVCLRLAEVFLTKSRDEWFQLLAFEADTCVAPVYESFEEVYSDPQAQHLQMMLEVDHPSLGKVKQVGIPIKLSDTPGSVRMLPPKPGQHTQEILKQLGYDEQKIMALRNNKIIA